MTEHNIKVRFTWSDIIEEGKYAGWGWSQQVTLQENSIEIKCRKLPETPSFSEINLLISAINHATLITYTDTGNVLHRYVAYIPFSAVLCRLESIPSPKVYIATSALLDGLSKEKLLTRLHDSYWRCRGRLLH